MKIKIFQIFAKFTVIKVIFYFAIFWLILFYQICNKRNDSKKEWKIWIFGIKSSSIFDSLWGLRFWARVDWIWVASIGLSLITSITFLHQLSYFWKSSVRSLLIPICDIYPIISKAEPSSYYIFQLSLKL